jgi:glycopeptide antibiotics resistance protein
MVTMRRVVLALVTLGYLLFVGWVTLRAEPYDDAVDSWIDLVIAAFSEDQRTAWITFGMVEFVANIFMFVPVGVLLTLLLGRKWWWVAALGGFALSLAIELVQLGIPSRVSDPRDVVSNGLGTTVGAIACFLVVGLADRRRSAAVGREEGASAR